jgi:hypothetical protein
MEVEAGQRVRDGGFELRGGVAGEGCGQGGVQEVAQLHGFRGLGRWGVVRDGWSGRGLLEQEGGGSPVLDLKGSGWASSRGHLGGHEVAANTGSAGNRRKKGWWGGVELIGVATDCGLGVGDDC